jgi:hypothetical protein
VATDARGLAQASFRVRPNIGTGELFGSCLRSTTTYENARDKRGHLMKQFVAALG